MSELAQSTRNVSFEDRLPLYALFTANAISLVGNVLTALAIPWFVLQTTGSAEKTGITGFFAALPIALAAFLGGTVVDRLGYKRTSIVADLASGVTVALIPTLFLFGALQFEWVLVLTFLTNLLDAPGSTARDALVPDLATRAGMSFERAGSLNQIIERSARLIGAPLAGLLIASAGATTVLWIDAATFLVSAAIFFVFVQAATHKRSAGETRHWRRELTDGLRFIWRDKLILTITLTVMVTNLLDNGVLMTIYFQQVFGSAVDLGLSIAAIGGGSVVGALLFGARRHRWNRRITFIALFILLSLRYFLYAFYPPLPVVILIQFLSGIAAGPINPLISTVEYERVPPDMRGRVFGAVTAGAMLMLPLGALFAGFAIGRFGLTATLLIVACAYVLTTGAMLFNPAMREMERRTHAEGETPVTGETPSA